MVSIGTARGAGLEEASYTRCNALLAALETHRTGSWVQVFEQLLPREQAYTYGRLVRSADFSDHRKGGFDHYPFNSAVEAINMILKRNSQSIGPDAFRNPKYSGHLFVQWMGDDENPYVMGKIEPFIGERKDATFIDIGAGSGEPALILAPRFLRVTFKGYEVVREKVEFANNNARRFGLKNVSFEEQNLSDPNFRVPAADFYYLYRPVHAYIIKKIINDILISTADQRKVTFFLRLLNVPEELEHCESTILEQRSNELGPRLVVVVCTNGVDERKFLKSLQDQRPALPKSVLDLTAWQKYSRDLNALIDSESQAFLALKKQYPSVAEDVQRAGVADFDEFVEAARERLFSNLLSSSDISIHNQWLFDVYIGSLLTEQKLSPPKDLNDVYRFIQSARPFALREWMSEIIKDKLHSTEELDRLRDVGYGQLLGLPANKSLRALLARFDMIEKNGTIDVARFTEKFWQLSAEHRTFLYRYLVPLVQRTEFPLKKKLADALYAVISYDDAALAARLKKKPRRTDKTNDFFETWLGDPGNPYAMFEVAAYIERTGKTQGTYFDIGAGSGEPATLLAPLFPSMHFHGFEFVPEKVENAIKTANRLGLKNVSYSVQDLYDPHYQVPAADFYYFFNPFGAHIFEKVLSDILTTTANQSEFTLLFRNLSYDLSRLRHCEVEALGQITAIRCRGRNVQKLKTQQGLATKTRRLPMMGFVSDADATGRLKELIKRLTVGFQRIWRNE